MQTDQLRVSLEKLLRQDSDDVSVLVEAANSGHFLQISGSKNEQLVLDVPVIELTQPEQRKVQELLKSHQPDFQQWGDDPNEASYIIKLGRDVTKAINLVVLLFTDGFAVNDDRVRVRQLD